MRTKVQEITLGGMNVKTLKEDEPLTTFNCTTVSDPDTWTIKEHLGPEMTVQWKKGYNEVGFYGEAKETNGATIFTSEVPRRHKRHSKRRRQVDERDRQGCNASRC